MKVTGELLCWDCLREWWSRRWDGEGSITVEYAVLVTTLDHLASFMHLTPVEVYGLMAERVLGARRVELEVERRTTST